MAVELDGPRLEPQAGGAARRLVVFLHGYGADGRDLIEIGRAWQPLMPDCAFVSPNAPEPCGQAPVGRQWFALTFRDPDERWIGVNKAAPVLERFLDAELARRALPPSALALVGFSQGTMMALHVGLRRATAPLAIVGYSGLLVEPPHEAPRRRPRSSPPRSHRARRSCWFMATATSSFRSRPCSMPPMGSARSGCRSNGTFRRASVTASTRKACAGAASSSRGGASDGRKRQAGWR